MGVSPQRPSAEQAPIAQVSRDRVGVCLDFQVRQCQEALEFGTDREEPWQVCPVESAGSEPVSRTDEALLGGIVQHQGERAAQLIEEHAPVATITRKEFFSEILPEGRRRNDEASGQRARVVASPNAG